MIAINQREYESFKYKVIEKFKKEIHIEEMFDFIDRWTYLMENANDEIRNIAEDKWKEADSKPMNDLLYRWARQITMDYWIDREKLKSWYEDSLVKEIEELKSKNKKER